MADTRTRSTTPSTDRAVDVEALTPVTAAAVVADMAETPVRQESLVTIGQWGRGRVANPIVRAFVAGHSAGRVKKLSVSAWDELYRVWFALPR